MNRTQRLMASMAAAMALLGRTQAGNAATSQAHEQQSSPKDAQAKAPSSTSEAAEAVFPKVQVSKSRAVSLDDLRKLLPDMDAKTIQAALDRLIYDGKIKRIRQSPEDPYKYYVYESVGG